MIKPKKAVKKVKGWAIVDSNYGFVNEIGIYRAILIANRNKYFEHNSANWPIRKLRLFQSSPVKSPTPSPA